MQINKMKPIDTNQGVILIIAVIFLFLSTLLGVSTLRGNLFNEKMTFSAIQHEKALEAAEAALLEGENFVSANANNIVNAVFTRNWDPLIGQQITAAGRSCQARVANAGGMCGPVERYANLQNNHENWVDIINGRRNSLNVWNTAGRSRNTNGDIKTAYNLNQNPQYIVEFMGFVPDTKGKSRCEGLASVRRELDHWPFCSLDRSQFRITAFAQVGNYDETKIMLQSTYVVN